MDKIENILQNLKGEKAFALTRFGDGELLGIRSAGLTVARGKQKVNQQLSNLLREAISHEQENYWVGIPCQTCWGEHRWVADKFVRNDYPYKTTAVVLTNRNWERFIDEFPKTIGFRSVYWIGGESHNPYALSELGIKISSHIKVPDSDAFSEMSNILPLINGFPRKSIVLMSCGPMSRVLTYLWYKTRQDITLLPVGDVFSPWVKKVYLRCHHSRFPDKTDKHPPCPECF